MADQKGEEGAGRSAGEGRARAEMAGARVWDRRCVESLVKIAEKLTAEQGSSFSSAVGHAGRQAAHRICSKEETSVEDLLQGHVAQTAARCGQYELVLVDQDTTTADYSTHQQTTGLGPVNTKADSRGLCIHSGFAPSPMGQPLGLLSARMWTRGPAEFGQTGKRRIQDVADKASQKWIDGMQDVEAALPVQQKVLLIQDRESDVFAFMAAERRANTHLLIRACQPRNVVVPGASEGEEERRGKLFDLVGEAPVAGEMAVKVPRQPGSARAPRYWRCNTLGCRSSRRGIGGRT